MRNKGPLLSRLTHANETKNATHTIIFLILVILRSFLFPSSIMVQLFWCFLNPEMAVGFVRLRAEVSLLHSVHEVICVACLSHSWFHCYISSVTSVNLKKAGMASRNIAIKQQYMLFLYQLCSSLWTSRSWFVCSSHTSHANNFIHSGGSRPSDKGGAPFIQTLR